jgi:N-acetyl-gamma-glutamylphosphate reductase
VARGWSPAPAATQPTVQFALRPLIGSGLIDLDDIICDLKNGVSGAGRSLKENMLFTERSEDVAGYSQGGKHRHLGEFDQEFSLSGRASGADPVHPASGAGQSRHPRLVLSEGRGACGACRAGGRLCR